jgi:hypothetical protein
MAGATPALGKCKVCRDQLLEIPGRNHGDPKRIVCPTCLADENEDLKAEAAELRREVRGG